MDYIETLILLFLCSEDLSQNPVEKKITLVPMVWGSFAQNHSAIL